MSKNNPNGRRLEDLIQDIIDDLEEKNQVLLEKPDSNKFVIATNNQLIIAMFKTGIEIQKRSMDFLQEKFGDDKGPEKPRI